MGTNKSIQFQALHNDVDGQVLFVDGRDRGPTNPRWRTAAILEKIDKSLYLRNHLTDFGEIWHGDRTGPEGTCSTW